MATFKRCLVFAWISCVAAVLLLAITLAFLVRYKELNGHSFLLGCGDQKPLLSGLLNGESFSRYYCDRLKVEMVDDAKDGESFNAYVLSEVPVPSGASYRQTMKKTLEIGSGGVTPPLAVNLHRGPNAVAWMKIHACSEVTNLELYRCPDASAADTWYSSKNNPGCKKLCSYSTCGTGKPNYCSFVANSARQVDEFILVLAASVGTPVQKKVSVDVNITRFPFDLRTTTDTCRNATQCDLPIVMTQTEAVVLEIPVNSAANSVNLRTHCSPRIGIYFAFYMGFPLAGILLVSLVVFLPCFLLQKTFKKQTFELQVKRLGEIQRAVSQNHEQASLIRNEHYNENW